MEIPLPKQLISRTGSVDLEEFKSARTKALYFGGKWDPACRRFNRLLSDFYHRVNKENKEIEVVFVSSDNSLEDFEDNKKDMPWLSVSYQSTETIEKLRSLYGVQGVPSVVIVDDDGKVLSREAEADIENLSDDPLLLLRSWKSQP